MCNDTPKRDVFGPNHANFRSTPTKEHDWPQMCNWTWLCALSAINRFVPGVAAMPKAFVLVCAVMLPRILCGAPAAPSFPYSFSKHS